MRIALAEQPYEPLIAAALDGIMPKGVPPLALFRTVARNPRVFGKMFAGGLLDSPVRVTPSATLGEEFLIPADAEIVLEGMIDLRNKEICGPWADVMRYYSPQTLEPIFTPTAFLMR